MYSGVVNFLQFGVLGPIRPFHVHLCSPFMLIIIFITFIIQSVYFLLLPIYLSSPDYLLHDLFVLSSSVFDENII